MLSTSTEVRSFEADLLGELCCGADEADNSGNSNECDSWQEAGECKKEELAPKSVSVQGSSWALWLNNTWSGIGCSLKKKMEKVSHKVIDKNTPRRTVHSIPIYIYSQKE